MNDPQGTPQEDPLPTIAVRIPPGDRPVPADYTSLSTEPLRMVTLRRMGVMEAQLARVKLESEGILCDIADQEMAITNPLIVSSVRLMVREADTTRAEEILSRPADTDAEGEYADEAWRCPQCHRRAVDLVPLSPGQWRARASCIVLATLPVLLALIRQLMPYGEMESALGDLIQWTWLPCLVVAMALVVATIKARRKQCRECGHQWEGQAEDD